MQIRALADADHEAWRRFVATAPGAAPPHDPGWERAIRTSLGHTPRAAGAFEGERLVGVLPLFLVRPPLLAPRLVSTPAANHAGPLAESRDALEALVAWAVREGAGLGVSHVELRTESDDPYAGFVSTGRFVSHHLDLDSDPERVFARLPKGIRRAIGRARRRGVRIDRGRDETALDAFWAVYRDTVDRHGTPGFSRLFFASLLEAFGDRATIVTASLDRRVLAADLVVASRERVCPVYTGLTTEGRRLLALHLATWDEIHHGCLAGSRVYDFGRSSRDTGAAFFKDRWGAREVGLNYRYHLPAGGQPPEFDPHSPFFRTASMFWRRLPRAVRWWLGPRIVPYLH